MLPPHSSVKMTLVPSLLKVAECQYAKPGSTTASIRCGFSGSEISNRIPLPAQSTNRLFVTLTAVTVAMLAPLMARLDGVRQYAVDLPGYGPNHSSVTQPSEAHFTVLMYLNNVPWVAL